MEPWICPRCGIVHAGWVAQCTCKPPTISASTTSSVFPVGNVACCCHLKRLDSTVKYICPVHDLQVTFTF
jgi:hypothetical protein